MDYYNEIKNELINNEINREVKKHSINRSDLITYYNVGKILNEAGKHYGENIIEKGATLSHQLSWSHYSELIPLNNINIANYYVYIISKQNLSVRQLRGRIKSKEYERLPSETRNNIINKSDSNITDFVKNPITIKNNINYEFISEKVLQKLILEDLNNFLKELGDGFCYIENEYKIKLGDKYNYIDLFLYNIKFKCYVVIELKVTELKKEHIGQIEVYMNYIDKNIKSIEENDTIGIIIVKKDNKLVLEYSSDPRIISREYIVL